jgi:peptidoglycan/xylan/chitin deacetylase (PgdA/CDA1 family)
MFSPNDKYIIINYHYIRNPSTDWGGIHPCSLAEFERQVKFLSENYRLVSVPEVFNAAQGGPTALRPQDDSLSNASRFCAITFDDGLRDQYENALPILQKYGATATFFIITKTLEGWVPSAHKIHLLTSKIPVEKLVGMFNEFLPKKHSSFRIPLDRKITEKRPKDSVATANFKETMIAAPEDLRAGFISKVFAELGLDEKKISEELFMKEAEIKNLLAGGFYPESHTHTHPSLENYSLDYFRKDFSESNARLAKIIGRNPIVMSYPHGRSNAETHKALAEFGFKYAVTIEARGILPDDNPYMIPRYDTNDLKDFLNTKNL